MNTQWWKSAVVYQIYPRSFQDSTGSGVGDLNGITSRLDYLKELGVDVIWLSPVYESPNVDNGYDISDYQAIMKEFGTMADFDRLLAEAHARGLRIVMDLVVNHTSDQHAWFAESRSSKDNPKRDWYIWRDGSGSDECKEPNKLRSVFSGPAWQFDEKTGQYYLHLFAVQQPDLNWTNPDVRAAVFAMMRWWLDKGIDGFRMDVIDAISKPESALAVSGSDADDCFGNPGVHDYLREMNEKVLSRYDIMTVGETPSAKPETARLFAGNDGKELSMIFQFEHVNADIDPELGKWKPSKLNLPKLKRIFNRWQTELHGSAWNSLFWDNHDQPRIVSRFGDDSTEESRVLSAKMLALCLHMMQGTPYVYQGEELGMTNYPFDNVDQCQDVEIHNAWRELVIEKKILPPEQMMAGIRKNSRDNARTPMQWDGNPNAGFTRGKPWLAVNPNHTAINAAAQVNDPGSVFSFYRRLIHLRKEYDIIVRGDFELLLPDDENLFCYRRRYEGTALTVCCNFSGGSHPRTCFEGLSFKPEGLLISNYAAEQLRADTILPWEACAVLG